MREQAATHEQEMVPIDIERRPNRFETDAADEAASVPDLVKRLAQESRELASIEVERLRIEVRGQARRAARVAVAGYLAIDLVAIASLALAVGVFLVLAGAWHSYAAAAFGTSALLGVIALCAGLVMRGLIRRIGDLDHAGTPGDRR